MANLTSQHLQHTKDLIFTQGRLLERQLFRYFFESGDRLLASKP